MSQQLRDQLQATLSGNYTLERELGGGGMSRVFVAEELRLKRKVVVKVLSPELAQGISVERFEREIQTAAALQQANIVPVLSAGDTNGLPFYTMPFVEGESLRARLARGPLSVTEVIGVLRDVSKALAYAHRQGVVHRDIKPDNVLLSEGTAVVTDFGIAKAISAARTSSGGATLTQIGTSIGTPAYMAPEQAAGDPDIDHRADIYALGAMAYELLSGQAVFANRTPQRMLAAHMGETPKPITEFRPDLPQALADLVMQCLAKEVGGRPQNASDIARVLESITSGSGMQALPPVLMGGPGMFRKALGIYAVAFVAVAILAKAAIVGIGLPDWVFPGSLIVMALGLPVVLWTGYVHRVARRAVTMTPTYTPGGSPSMMQGTIATMALKAAPKMSWYKTARGGMYAFGAFVVVIGAFMAMRAFGIGPFGSLLANGELKADDRVLLTDFTVSGGDSTLGRVVSEAVRAGLIQSNVFTLVTPAQTASALQRMQKPNTARVDLATARAIAQREGYKAIVDGDVATVAGSYIVAVRLVTADSGRELTSFRATAAGPDKLIEAADKVTREMRSKAGESLRKIQAGKPLAEVTTSSLAALRKYSEGVRANDVEIDNLKAIRLLREAVAIDPQFAEAWRKLSVSMRNQGFSQAQSDSALSKAYELRDRLNEHERDIIVAYYYLGGPGHDADKAIATYEGMLARGDSVNVLNNLGQQYMLRGDLARAETVYAAGARRDPSSQLLLGNLIGIMQQQAKFGAVDSLVALGLKRFPASTGVRWAAIQQDLDRGRIGEYRKAVDSARKVPDPRDPSAVFYAQLDLALNFGRRREAKAFAQQAIRLDSTVGRAQPDVVWALRGLAAAVDARVPFDAELRALDAALAKSPLEKMAVADRPYLYLAGVLAYANKPDRARAILAQHRAAVTDPALRREQEPNEHAALASLAVAERRWAEAIDETRKANLRANGAPRMCVECLPKNLIYVFSEAGMPDSVIAQYQAYRKTPIGARKLEGPDMRLGADVLERIAKSYDAKNDSANAAEVYRQFVDRWKEADPELQPRVSAARERIKKLTGVEKP